MKSNEPNWDLMSQWAQTSLNEHKWAENQNGPKWAYMRSKDLKYIENDPNDLKIGLNELKWVSLNKLKRA